MSDSSSSSDDDFFSKTKKKNKNIFKPVSLISVKETVEDEELSDLDLEYEIQKNRNKTKIDKETWKKRKQLEINRAKKSQKINSSQTPSSSLNADVVEINSDEDDSFLSDLGDDDEDDEDIEATTPNFGTTMMALQQAQMAKKYRQIREKQNDLLIQESQKVSSSAPLAIESSSDEDEDAGLGSPTTTSENKIKINVRLPNGSILKFNIDPNYKVDKLLTGISSKIGINKKDIKLKFDGEVMAPNNKMDEFEDDDLIELLTSVPMEEQILLIFRFNKDHPEYKMKVSSSETIKSIQEKLEKEKKFRI
eukprot:gene1855-996_t